MQIQSDLGGVFIAATAHCIGLKSLGDWPERPAILEVEMVVKKSNSFQHCGTSLPRFCLTIRLLWLEPDIFISPITEFIVEPKTNAFIVSVVKRRKS